MMDSNEEDPITTALRKARYNEIVHIVIPSSSEDANVAVEGTGQSVVQDSNDAEVDQEVVPAAVTYCLSPAVTPTGIQFNAIPDDEILSRHLQAKHWFFPMLNDSRRNQLFHDAIIVCMKELVDKTPVLDIGSGTGLLAMMSASHEKCSSVVSVEMSASMSAIARQTIEANGLTSSIRLITNHSTAVDVRDNPTRERFGVCTSELLDDGLLGEGWIPAMRDAWERLLTPECQVLPQRARMWGQLVTTTFSLAAPLGRSRPSDPHCYPIQATRLLREQIIQPRSVPFLLFEFDVTSKAAIPPPVGRERVLAVRTKQPSTEDLSPTAIDAVLVWWDIDIFGGLLYSTDPSSSPFQDHWHPCLHFLNTSATLPSGEEVTLQVEHDDYRLKIDLLTRGDARKRIKVTEPNGLANFKHSSWGVERTLQLGDESRGEKMRRTMGRILNEHQKSKTPIFVLDVSDCCWAGSIAATCFPPSSNSECPVTVLSLESSSGDLPEKTGEWIGNIQESNRSSVQWEVRRGYTEQLNPGNIPQISLIIAEPYYEVLEGWHLQEALNLYAVLSVLRQNQVVSASTRIVPRLCRVKGCLIESDTLRSAYNRCGDSNGRVQGFDHSYINGLAWPKFAALSLPMWQYEYSKLSPSFDLGCLSYIDPSLSVLAKMVDVTTNSHGRIDAMVVWVEYSLDEDEDETVTTNNATHRQLVHMLDDPIESSDSPVEVQCSARLGEEVGGDADNVFEVKAIKV